MGGSETNRRLNDGPLVASRGLLGQTASCILTLRGKLLSLRRRQLLVILAIFAVIVIVLQAQDLSFFDDLKMGKSNPLAPATITTKEPVSTEDTSIVVKKTAFEAVTVVSGPENNADNNSDASRNVDRTTAGHNKNEKVGEELRSQSGNSISIASNKNEQNEVAKSYDKDEKDGLSVADSTEQDDVDAAYQNQTQKGVIRNLHTNKLVKNIGYTRTRCYSVSGEPREQTCAPSVVVAGYEKCGTSALYYKLTKHPEIVAHPKWKENCPSEDSLEAMWSWFDGIPILEQSTSNGLLLNGCIGIVSRSVILKELQRLNRDLKVLVALRNYADWSYSFYGYRCYPGYDEGCETLEKPNSYGPWKETRNPENFAKLVKEIEETGKSPYDAFRVIQPNAYLFRPWLEELVDIVGQKAVKIIKQEDLSYSPQETLANVADFLEMDAAKFPDEAYTLVSNTNDHPAEIIYVNETATKAEISYVINSGSFVLNETRTLLDNFWSSECEWLRDNFDVHFTDVC